MAGGEPLSGKMRLKGRVVSGEKWGGLSGKSRVETTFSCGAASFLFFSGAARYLADGG